MYVCTNLVLILWMGIHTYHDRKIAKTTNICSVCAPSISAVCVCLGLEYAFHLRHEIFGDDSTAAAWTGVVCSVSTLLCLEHYIYAQTNGAGVGRAASSGLGAFMMLPWRKLI